MNKMKFLKLNLYVFVIILGILKFLLIILKRVGIKYNLT
jgi:hypothetical protein